MVYLFVTIFGGIGGYLPVLFGAGGLSLWSVLGSAFGGFLGIYVAYKLSS
jgi:hypothetical protein